MVTVNETNREPDGTFGALEATETINAADLSSAAQDEVLKKAASGSDLTFGTVQTEPNVPDEELDGNSPDSATGVNSFTYTLSGTYDLVEVDLTITKPSSESAIIPGVQLNGDTGSNYNYVEFDGGVTSGDNEFARIFEVTSSDEFTISGKFALQGDGQGGISYSNISLMAKDNIGSSVATGFNPNVTTPLDSFTIFVNDGRAFDITTKVYGRNI